MAKKVTVDSSSGYWGTNAKEIITVISKKSATINANGGNDSIIVNNGNDHQIYAGKGKDTITVKKGNRIRISGEKGNDIINIKKGNNHVIHGDTSTWDDGDNSPSSGNDKITLFAGKGHKVYGGKGADKIYVRKGAGFSVIYGNEGNDTITVYKGAKAGKKNNTPKIYGGKGNDRITVTNEKYYTIYGDAGNDTIKVTGGEHYRIESGYYSADKNKKDVITVNNVKHFDVENPSKGSVTITGCSNGSVDAGENTTVKVKNSSSVKIAGGKIFINEGCKNVTITSGDSEFLDKNTTDEQVTIKSGNGTARLGGGTDALTIDFKDATKIGNWEISAENLTNNRLTVLNASSTDFKIERKIDTHGLGILVDADCWIMKNNKTGATITLSGWNQSAEKTFGIFFGNDKMLVYGEPAKDKTWMVKYS